MAALRPNARQNKWLRIWLTVSFAVLFTGPFLYHSRIPLLNTVDVLFFLPSLTLLTRALVSGDHRLLLDKVLLPLYVFLGWVLLTMAWAPDPNSSRTVRAVVEIIILVGMMRWLHLYYRHTLKHALANGAMAAMVVLAVIIVSYYTIQPLSSPLYSRPASLIFDLPQPGPMLATMGLVAPTFILLAQALDEGFGPKGARRAAGALVGFAFLLLVHWQSGVMLLVAALAWGLLRAGWRWPAALAGAVALYLALDFSVLQHIGDYLTHPIFGNGFNQESGDTLIVNTAQGIRFIPDPDNILLSLLHSTGVIGLILFVATWAMPAWKLPSSGRPGDGAVFLVAVVPGLLAMLMVGNYLLVPFHSSWMSLWLPLALMLASLSVRQAPRGTVHAG